MRSDAERPIGFTLRALLAVIGLATLVAAFIVGTAEFRSTTASSFPALALAAFLLVIAAGGVLLVRGAIRGRIRFRRIRRSAARDR